MKFLYNSCEISIFSKKTSEEYHNYRGVQSIGIAKILVSAEALCAECEAEYEIYSVFVT
jgi:hypothetical protein